jgi:hypothetical protein
MRLEQLNLSEIFKSGLSKTDVEDNKPGLAYIKNLRSDGSCLKACPTETVSRVTTSVKPFSVGLLDYDIRANGVYKAGVLVYSYAFSGRVSIVNLISMVWLQDSVRTLFVDKDGVYALNPSGSDVPLCNSMVTMNAQILAGGILSSSYPGLNRLDAGYVAWAGIGMDSFELTKSNDAGSYHPNIGTVFDILPMQDSAIVLGSRGACQMYYAGHTFGFRDIDVPLLKAKGLCASSTNNVIYVAIDGSVVSVDKNGAPTNLGYAWIGKDVSDVRYLNGRNSFVFTTATGCYLLDGIGMYSYGYRVYGETNSTLVVENAFEQSTWAFQTNFVDMDRVSVKIMQEVFVRDSISSITRTVTGYAESLATTQGAKNLNKDGVCKYTIAGSKLAVFYISSVAPAISELILQYVTPDRRFGNPSLGYRRSV